MDGQSLKSAVVPGRNPRLAAGAPIRAGVDLRLEMHLAFLGKGDRQGILVWVKAES